MAYEGKRDMDETICTIRWCVEDLLEAFEKNDVEPTDENIDEFLGGYGPKGLKDRSIEEGWEILDTLVYNEFC